MSDQDAAGTTVGLSGAAAIMARYQGQVAVFRAIVPRGGPVAESAGFAPVNFIDELASRQWQSLGVAPSGPCDDAEFLRRVYLDLAGRIPETRLVAVADDVALLADRKRHDVYQPPVREALRVLLRGGVERFRVVADRDVTFRNRLIERGARLLGGHDSVRAENADSAFEVNLFLRGEWVAMLNHSLKLGQG